MTMELSDYIDRGVEITGSLTALGLTLGLSQPRMSKMKRGKEHMPIICAIALADLIESDRFLVIAASEKASAKDENEFEYWRNLLEQVGSLGKAASVALAFSLVTYFVTPTPAEAAQQLKSSPERLCIM